MASRGRTRLSPASHANGSQTQLSPPAESGAAAPHRREPSGGREPSIGIRPREVVANASAILVFLFLVKLYGVARYSLTTTPGLLAATPGQVALGTVSIFAYYLLPAMGLGTVWFAVVWRRRIHRAVWPVIAIVAVSALLTSPMNNLRQGLYVIGAALAVELLLHRLLRRMSSRRSNRSVSLLPRLLRAVQGLSILYLGGATLAIAFLSSLETPWVPAQVFVLTSPTVTAIQDPMLLQKMHLPNGKYRAVSVDRNPVGYLIGEDDGWLTVLNAETRYIMHIRASDVRARLTCHQEAGQLKGDRPLMWQLTGKKYVSPNLNCDQVKAYVDQTPPTAQFQPDASPVRLPGT